MKNVNNSLKYLYNMTVSKDNYYSGNLDFNGVYVIGNKKEKVKKNMWWMSLGITWDNKDSLSKILKK